MVADIGTDHGRLPVYLVQSGRCPAAIAVDLRPAPLAKAQALVRQRGLEARVQCRLGNGLQALQPGEAGEIVIAGLSGESIAEILAAAPWTLAADVHLVLVPTGRLPQLRRWLCEAGYDIRRELPVAERGRAYSALSVWGGGWAHRPGALFCELGRLPAAAAAAPEGAKAAARLLQSRVSDLRRRALAPLPEAQHAALQRLTQEVEACLRFMTS